MNQYKTASAFLVVAALGILAFQNCSKVNFTSDAAIANSTSGTVVPTLPPTSVPTEPNVPEVLKTLQPTLAVRAMGCVQCHAEVASNIVTDFGFGNDYFFAQKSTTSTWNNNNIYGDHSQETQSMKIAAGQSVYVPKNATLPAVVQSATGTTTLKGYLDKQFATADEPVTRGTTVKELSAVYIGAPTDADLVSAFSLKTTDRMQYQKSKKATANLSGLVDTGTFFRNSGTLVCDGDLILRGPVHLENLVVSTVAGCRLYVIGSVFIHGKITYANLTATSNLQITSSRSISLGLGMELKNGSHCEPTSRWANNNGDSSYSQSSSLRTRFVDLFTTKDSFLRGVTDPVANGNAILAEAAVIQNATGTFYDASCEPTNGINVAFERMLLNAPIIHSRYSGDFKGTIIAEVLLMRLNAFKFEFDPVFNSVDVLPYLDPAKFISRTN